VSDFINRDSITLARRDIEDYTKPILYVDHYVIFKRIKKE
jgi:hypothetical protein